MSMMNYVLFDDSAWSDLLPLTFTRPACEIRIGILTIKEKWELVFKKEFSYRTQTYLSAKFPFKIKEKYLTLFINGRVCPDATLFSEIKKLKMFQVLYLGNIPLAYCGDADSHEFHTNFSKIYSKSNPTIIQYPWDIFRKNENQLIFDFILLTNNRKSKALSKSNTLIGKGKVFVESGASVECATINPLGGFVYIGKDAVVMEGCHIRGSFSLGEYSELKMGAKICGATTIGTHCKVGGEVNNSVIFGYSNKAHDGFLGNSVVGEWCNLGADTNNSNLKNNYADVKAYNYTKGKMIDTGLQFCGLLMGDHSKTGINTMLNTGTVVGVNANIFGGGFPPSHIPSFSWGGAEGFSTYELDKAITVAERVMQRRGITISDADKKILAGVFKGVGFSL